MDQLDKHPLKAAATTTALAVMLAAFLIWGAPGPTAGEINNPRSTIGTVALVDQENPKLCSIQASFTLKGRYYTTGQSEYGERLCRFKLGQSVQLAYNYKSPSQAKALQPVSDPPLWPAFIVGVLLLLSTAWLISELPRRQKAPPQADQEKKVAPAKKDRGNDTEPAQEAAVQPTEKDPPGWYPAGGGRLRWWNGSRWTDNYQQSKS